MQKNVLLLGLKDWLTPKFLMLSFIPFALSVAIMVGLFILFEPALFALLDKDVSWLKSIPYAGALASTFLYILGILLATFLGVFVAIFVIGFFTPTFIKAVQKRHYPEVELKDSESMVAYLIFSVRVIVGFLVLFIVLIPFYFLPFINLFAMHIPFYFLFYKFVPSEVSALIGDKEEIKQIYTFARGRIFSNSLTLYLISLIPFAGIIFQSLFVIVFAHLFLQETQKVRGH